MRYGAQIARRTWNCVSRVQIINTVVTASLNSVRGGLTVAFSSGAIFPRPPANPTEAEEFRQLQANMRSIVDSVVETAISQAQSEVRDAMDEKMPEESLNTIVPPERREDIDAFEAGLPNIPETYTSIAIVEADGREACMTFAPHPSSQMGLGRVTEIPCVRLQAAQNLAEELNSLYSGRSQSPVPSSYEGQGQADEVTAALFEETIGEQIRGAAAGAVWGDETSSEQLNSRSFPKAT